jgi:hypothetical protein
MQHDLLITRQTPPDILQYDHTAVNILNMK